MPSEEIFDVVDLQDRVIASAPRSIVHRDGLLHRAVHVLIFNSRGDVFLQKRSKQKDTHPLHWDSSASGHLDRGEDYDTAAMRECKEELGWEAVGLKRIAYVEAQPLTGNEFVWIYKAQADGPFTLNKEEICDGGWFPVDAVLKPTLGGPEPLSPCFALIWSIYQGSQRPS